MKCADQNVHADRHHCYRHMSNWFSHNLVAIPGCNAGKRNKKYDIRDTILITIDKHVTNGKVHGTLTRDL